MDNTWLGFAAVVVTILASHFISHAQFHRELRELADRVSKLETTLTERIAHMEGTLTAVMNMMSKPAIEQRYRSDVVQTRERQDDQ